MNYYWNATPLLRYLLLLIGGILFSIYFPILHQTIALVICLALLIILFLQHLSRKTKFAFKYRWLSSIAALLLSFFSGYLITLVQSESRYPNHFRNLTIVTSYIGYVEQPISEKPHSYKTELKITNALRSNQWIEATGNCIVYFSKDSLSSTLKYGDLILFSEIPEEIKSPANPSQFDYKRYLAFQNIYDEVYISSEHYSVLGHHHGIAIIDYAVSIREKFLGTFRHYGINGQDYAVLSAIVLGYRSEIDHETMEAYSSAGVVHVLVVAGLHVGFIFLLLNTVLMFLDRRKKTRILKTILISSFLLFYAVITGLSPSVCRATLMLLFVIVGNQINRTTSIYNTLAASAFVLLCWNPLWLMNAGFQLSYLAVIGIVSLQQRIYQWIDINNGLFSKVWRIIAVSCAAQLATFPLCIFYYHRFTNYFVPANLIAIPLMTIIIWGAVALLFFSGWSIVAKAIAAFISHLVHWLNLAVATVEHLPHAVFSGLSISFIETCLLYLLILLAVISLLKRNPYYSFGFLSVLIILFLSRISKAIATRDQQYFIVYNIPKQSVLNIINGNENLLIADTAIASNRNLLKSNICNFWWEHGLNDENVTIKERTMKSSNSQQNAPCYSFNKLKFIPINRTTVDAVRSATITDADFIILSENVRLTLKTLITHIKCKKIIIDSSNSIYKATQWVDEAKELGLACHSVPHQGAFVYEMKN